MSEFKKSWNLEMALAVLENPTIDSHTWSEAVEWLLLFGPPHIRHLIEQASHSATTSCYPELKPSGYGPDGEPCYDIDALADTLGIEREEVLRKIAQKEEEHGRRHLFIDEENIGLQ